jgi:hypothetical protein
VGDGSWVLGGVLGGRRDESGWPASKLRSLVTAAELQHDCSRVAAELQQSCSTVAAQLQHKPEYCAAVLQICRLLPPLSEG